jgi:hypothetical protein
MALMGAAVGAQAQHPPAIPLEGSVETTTDAVILPSSLLGRVTVRNCEGCESPTLQLDAHTVLELNGRTVSLAEFARYAQASTGKSLTIHYRLSNRIVSRITVLEP